MIKSIILAILIGMAAVIPWNQGRTNEPVNTKKRYAVDHIIVKLNESSKMAASFIADNDLETIAGICSTENIKLKSVKKLFPGKVNKNSALYNKYQLGRYYVVFFKEEIDPKKISGIFLNNAEVKSAEPDFIGETAGSRGNEILPNDLFFNRQWGLNNNGQMRTTTGNRGKEGADINVIKGWDLEIGSEDVVVAILDSGVKLDHPDLYSRIWMNRNEIKNGKDDDGNGYIDDIYGYNFAYGNSNVRDDLGHGTNITGTIGASTNNVIGYAGVDQKCRLMICKNVSYENSGEYSWWAESITYAADNGAMIINMSEGGYDYSETLETAVRYATDAGCLIIASMMNNDNGEVHYPASFPEVLAVGATDTDDGRCREFTWGGGSNWGKNISVVAPGNKIYGLDFRDNYNYDNYYSGTSQSTAFVSGVASLLLAQDFSRTNRDIRSIITSTAVDQIGDPREDSPGWDEYYGYGRVDLFAALSYGFYPTGVKNDNNKENNKIKDKDKNQHDNNKDLESKKDSKKPNEGKDPSGGDDDKRAKRNN
jgi:thermitase